MSGAPRDNPLLSTLLFSTQFFLFATATTLHPPCYLPSSPTALLLFLISSTCLCFAEPAADPLAPLLSQPSTLLLLFIPMLMLLISSASSCCSISSAPFCFSSCCCCCGPQPPAAISLYFPCYTSANLPTAISLSEIT